MPDSALPPGADPLPGSRWPLAVARPIAAPAAQVWAMISMPGNLEPCHPFCRENPVERWPGAGSRERVCYLNGLVLERRFRHWIDGVGDDLEAGRPGGRASLVSWRILKLGPGRSALQITIYPHLLQQVPVAVRWLPHLVRLRPMLATYLRSVLAGFEWCVIRGEPVPRNRFGRHPWFSAPATLAARR